jgi:hypothetical protein
MALSLSANDSDRDRVPAQIQKSKCWVYRDDITEISGILHLFPRECCNCCPCYHAIPAFFPYVTLAADRLHVRLELLGIRGARQTRIMAIDQIAQLWDAQGYPFIQS